MPIRLLAPLLAAPCVFSLRSAQTWPSPPGRGLPKLDAEICVVDVPRSNSDVSCKFISQGLCKGGSLKDLQGGHRKCLRKQSSCAIVGSSEHLLNASYGAEIDKHEAIIRLNAAPADKQFHKHVGSRTDYRFLNGEGTMPENEARMNNGKMCIFLHEPYVPCGRDCWKGVDWCHLPCAPHAPGSFYWKACSDTCKLNSMTCKANLMKEEGDWGDNYVFMDLVQSGVARHMVYKPTAGLKALAFALHHCEKVSIYGFGPTCSGRLGGRYYDGGALIQLWHSYREEVDLFEAARTEGPQAFLKHTSHPEGWLETKQIEVHHPSCVPMQASQHMNKAASNLLTMEWHNRSSAIQQF